MWMPETPLHIASEMGMVDVVPHKTRKVGQGQTPSQKAVERPPPRRDVMQYLLEHGAEDRRRW